MSSPVRWASSLPTLGPLGQEESGYDLRSIGASLSGVRVAGVTSTGTDLVVAPTESPSGEVATVIFGAVDLAAPHWDYRDRIWALDRNNGRARVFQVVDGAAEEVAVPGFTGRRLTELIVSRDGSRLVAVVRTGKADRVVSVRVRHDSGGAVIGFTGPQVLPEPAEGTARIRDIAWRSPTTVSVLRDIITEGLSQVRTVSVDGAPGEISTGGTTTLRGRIRTLVSTPVDLVEAYAVAGRVGVRPHAARALGARPAARTDVAHLRRLIHRRRACGCRRTTPAAGMAGCSTRPSTCSSAAGAWGATCRAGCSARPAATACRAGHGWRGRHPCPTDS